jgi:tryptophan synthase alpha subunit
MRIYPVLLGFGTSDVVRLGQHNSAHDLDGVVVGSVVTTHLLI